MPPHEQKKKLPFLKRVASVLGPGLITGAADDDPSGVATYSLAGAQLGTTLVWTALLTWPLIFPEWPTPRRCSPASIHGST